jgi:O-antigen/teichoic acid export membrane protein
MQPRATKIFAAYGTSILGIASGLLTNLWLIRSVTREVSSSDFGTYAFVLQIIAYLGIMQLGLDFAASRKIAESLARDDESAASQAYAEVARFNRVAGVVLGVTILVVGGVLWSGIGPSGHSQGLAGRIVLLSGSATVTNFFSRKWSAALIGGQHQEFVNTLSVLNSLAVTVLAYVLLRLGLGILSLPAGYLIGACMTAAASSMGVRKLCPWLRRDARQHDPVLMRSMLRFGSYSTLGSIAWTIEVTSDVAILGAIGGTAAVANYVLWWRFPSMIFDLCTRLVGAAFPTFAERHGGTPDSAAALLGKVGWLSAGLASLSLVGIGLWLPAFMRLWLGGAYVLADGHAVAVAFGTVVALRTFGNLLGMFWLASGDARFGALLGWAQAGVKVLLALFLAPHLGILGLAASSVAASALQVGGLAVLLRRRGFLERGKVTPWVVMTCGAIVLASVGFRAQAGTSVATFAGWAILTAVAWSGMWLYLAWRGPLRPNLEGMFQRGRSASGA